jgi:hypothetical protein
VSRIARLVMLRHQYLFEYRMERGAPAVDPLPAGYHLALPAAIADVGAAQLEGGEVEAAMLRARCAAGDVLGVIWHGGRVAHRSLVQRAGVAPVEGQLHAFPVASDEAYIRNCETARDHYGRGLYPTMLRSMLAMLHRGGDCRRALIACRTDNVASIRGIEKAGFVRVARGVTVGVMGGRLGATRWRPTTSHPTAAGERA